MKDFGELLFDLILPHPKFKEFWGMLCSWQSFFALHDNVINSWADKNFDELQQIFSTIKFGNTKFEFNGMMLYPILRDKLPCIEVVFKFIFSEKYYNEFAIEFPLSMLECGKLPKSYNEYETIFKLLEI